MATVNKTALDFLESLAQEQLSLGTAGSHPTEAGFNFGDMSPRAIHTALSRQAIHEAFEKAAMDGVYGDIMTLVDEADLMASYERVVQRRYTARTRRLAHVQSRAVGHSDPKGLLKNSLQDIMTRDDSD